jgi:simple sugar transport system permease protein
MAAITIIVLLKWTGLASKSAQGICTRHVASGAYGSEWFGLESTSSLVCLFAAIAAGGYWWLWRTGAGLRLRASGINERASSLLGLKREKIELWAVALAGSCGGLVGLLNTLGTRRFSLDALTGLGFDGILVAIMGRHRASGVLLTSVFLAMWRNFAVEMQSRGLPYESYILAQALFLIVYLLKNRKPSYD